MKTTKRGKLLMLACAALVAVLACLPLLYWLNRVWLMARRGEVEGDPVAFAIRDRRSLVLGAMIGAIFIAALLGPQPLLDPL